MKIPLNNDSNLDIHISHSKGKYNLYVHKEKTRIVDVVEFVEYSPFDEGNFCTTLLEGRKSSKKLEKLNSLLETNKKIITDFWTNGKYGNLVYCVDSLVKTTMGN